MKTDRIYISDNNMNKIFYNFQQQNGSSNNVSRNKMKSILVNAIDKELTDKQRQCLVDYYIYGKKEKDIAAELSLSPSTISRHISSAKRKLRRIAYYYC